MRRDHGTGGVLAGLDAALAQLMVREAALGPPPSELGPDEAPRQAALLTALERDLDAVRGEAAAVARRLADEAELASQRREWEGQRRRAEATLANLGRRLDEARARVSEAEDALAESDLGKGGRAGKGKRGDARDGGRKALVAARADLRRLETQAREAEATLVAPFEPRTRRPEPPLDVVAAPAPTAFMPDTAPAPETHPTEALPRVGRLLASRSGRLLAIGRWEHLEAGRAEAQRLGARLVAEPW